MVVRVTKRVGALTVAGGLLATTRPTKVRAVSNNPVADRAASYLTTYFDTYGIIGSSWTHSWAVLALEKYSVDVRSRGMLGPILAEGDEFLSKDRGTLLGLSLDNHPDATAGIRVLLATTQDDLGQKNWDILTKTLDIAQLLLQSGRYKLNFLIFSLLALKKHYRPELDSQYQQLGRDLYTLRNSDRGWPIEGSSVRNSNRSDLDLTAAATIALDLHDNTFFATWRNEDGGWGIEPDGRRVSSVPTTCWVSMATTDQPYYSYLANNQKESGEIYDAKAIGTDLRLYQTAQALLALSSKSF